MSTATNSQKLQAIHRRVSAMGAKVARFHATPDSERVPLDWVLPLFHGQLS